MKNDSTFLHLQCAEQEGKRAALAHFSGKYLQQTASGRYVRSGSNAPLFRQDGRPFMFHDRIFICKPPNSPHDGQARFKTVKLFDQLYTINRFDSIPAACEPSQKCEDLVQYPLYFTILHL